MKKILLIFITIIFILSVGCVNLDEYVSVEEYNDLQQASSKILAERDSLIEDSVDLTSEIYDLENNLNSVDNDLQLTEEELGKYKKLINNLNGLLGNVYYMECENSKYTNWGTGFSIRYKENFYILTAGHYVEDTEYNTGKYYNFRFKVNGKWVYPKLLVYNNKFEYNNDYAVFYSDKIDNGLKIGEYTKEKFILGNTTKNLNILRVDKNRGIAGECGSPIISLSGEVIGVYIGTITPIEKVIEAIDNLEGL